MLRRRGQVKACTRLRGARLHPSADAPPCPPAPTLIPPRYLYPCGSPQGVDAAAAEKVLLYGQIPPIEKIDNSLQSLKAVKHLALSSNNIDKISGLSGLDQLQVLSLGRNAIKKIENLDPVAETLEELWLSYNSIASLNNLSGLSK